MRSFTVINTWVISQYDMSSPSLETTMVNRDNLIMANNQHSQHSPDQLTSIQILHTCSLDFQQNNFFFKTETVLVNKKKLKDRVHRHKLFLFGKKICCLYFVEAIFCCFEQCLYQRIKYIQALPREHITAEVLYRKFSSEER